MKYMPAVGGGEMAGDDEEQTLREIQTGRQQLLAPKAGVPEGKVMDVKKKGARTRGSVKDDEEQAAALEKQSQDRAMATRKKQRLADLAESSARAQVPCPPRKRAPPVPKRSSSGAQLELDMTALNEGNTMEDQ